MSLCVLVCRRVLLCVTFGRLKPSWGHVGVALGPLGAMLNHLGTILGPPWGTDSRLQIMNLRGGSLTNLLCVLLRVVVWWCMLLCV